MTIKFIQKPKNFNVMQVVQKRHIHVDNHERSAKQLIWSNN
jgi:hypothetical protein